MVVVLIILVSMSERSLAPPYSVICIDPGHGWTDPGCIGGVYGVLEKDVNFGVGHTAWQYFGLANYNPLMTRYEHICINREK